MKPERTSAFRADVFPGLSEYLKRKRQLPPRKEGSGYPAFGVGMVESLEARRMFASVSFDSGTGVLTVTGTSGVDTIEVFQVNGSPTLIKVDDTATVHTNSAWTSTAVTRVDVSALGSGDTVTIRRDSSFDREPLNETTRIYGGDGDDFLYGGTLADTIYGDAGHDSIEAFGDNDLCYGGYGGNDTVDGGNGSDIVYGGNPAVTNEGEADTLRGGEGNDFIHGEGGSDGNLSGGPGNDIVYGGDGNDDVQGDDDNDTCYGGEGNDTINGNAGSDVAYGGNGNDVFNDDGGADSYYGEAGNDTFNTFDGVTDFLDGGADTDTANDFGQDSKVNFP